MTLLNSQPAIPEAALEQDSPEFRAWVETLPDAHWAKHDLSACRLGWEAGRRLLMSEPAALDNSKPIPAVGDDRLIERLRAHARMIGMMVNPKTNRNSSADLINEAAAALTAALTAANDRIAELERERDEAREYGKQARLRENAAEDARIHEHDLRVAAEAELARLQSVQPVGDRPESEEVVAPFSTRSRAMATDTRELSPSEKLEWRLRALHPYTDRK